MPQVKPLLKVICFFLLTSGFGSCSPRLAFDFRTARPPEVFDKTSPEEHLVPLLALAYPLETASPEGERQEIPPTDLYPASGLAAFPKAEKKSLPMESPGLVPPAFVSAYQKEILLSRQGWKQSEWFRLKSNNLAKKVLPRKKSGNSLVSPAKNPFNQGILAAFLILGLGTAIIVLSSLLPSIGTIVAWVLGVMVLLVGIAFLALTLMGFTVRIIG